MIRRALFAAILVALAAETGFAAQGADPLAAFKNRYRSPALTDARTSSTGQLYLQAGETYLKARFEEKNGRSGRPSTLGKTRCASLAIRAASC